MTKRDFEFIASIFASAELMIENDGDSGQRSDSQTSYASEILDYMIEKAGAEIQKTHPRFKPAIFGIASRPIRNGRLRDEIIRAIAADPS